MQLAKMLINFGLLTLIKYIETIEYYNMKKSKIEGKIVGGNYTNIADFPHAVHVYKCSLPSKSSCNSCGSSVLNQRVLVTAAHCVDSEGKVAIEVRAGATDFLKAQVLIDVIYYTIHDLYKSYALIGDIALLFLSNDLPLGSNIKRVIMKSYFPARTEGYVAGWGSASEDHDKNTRLKVVDQKVWINSECAKYEPLKPGVMCATSGKTNLAYPFQGDSGSGLITKDHQVIGVVSYRAEGVRLDLISYTNISYYKEWIEEVANILNNKCKALNDSDKIDISTKVNVIFEEKLEFP